MELAFAVVFILAIAAVVGGAGLMFGRWMAPKFEQLVDDRDEQAVSEHE